MFLIIPNKMVMLLSLFVACVVSNTAHAKVDFLNDGYEEKYFDHDEGPGVEDNAVFNNQTIRYMYDDPTIKTMSHLFWSLGLYKTVDDWAVDEYMRINECDLYKKFFIDEFEWVKVRDATKIFLNENLKEFPTRFNVIIPLKLQDYDEEKGSFVIQDKYKIKAVRRFQVVASDYAKAPCSYAHVAKNGYPRILHLEFSRPFNLTGISMSKEQANKYVKSVNLEYDKVSRGVDRGEAARYNFRNIFLVMNVKIFAHGKTGFDPTFYVPVLKVLGTLESYEIYGDKERSDLMLRVSFISGKRGGELNILMKDQYKALMEMSAGDGVMK